MFIVTTLYHCITLPCIAFICIVLHYIASDCQKFHEKRKKRKIFFNWETRHCLARRLELRAFSSTLFVSEINLSQIPLVKNMVNIWRGHIFGINPSFQIILMLDIKSTSPCWPSYPKIIYWQPPPQPAGTKSHSGNMTFSCTKWKRVGDNHNKKWRLTCW